MFTLNDSKMGFVVTALVLMSISTFAGEGRNGPDLSGQSVPINMDRAFNVPELITATKKCALVEAQALFQQIFKRPAERVSNLLGSVGGDSQGVVTTGDLPSSDPTRSVLANVELIAKGPFIQPSFLSLALGGQYSPYDRAYAVVIAGSQAEQEMLSIGQGAGQAVSFTIPQGIPHYRFDQSIVEPKFDDYGIQNGGKEVLKNLRVFTPAEPKSRVYFNRVTPPQMGAYVSGQYSAPTRLFINTQRYAECLKSELQN